MITTITKDLWFTLGLHRCINCGRFFALETGTASVFKCSNCLEARQMELHMSINKLERQLRGARNYLKGLKK